MNEQMEVRIARLESDVQHIRTDVSDIKVELRRTNDRLEQGFRDVNSRIDGLNDKLDQGLREGAARTDGVRESLSDKIDDVDKRLSDKIDGVEKSLSDKIDTLRDELMSMKVWALGLYIALAGSLLFVMAKGFKWL